MVGVVCLAVVGGFCHASVSANNHVEWIAFKLKHGKSYASQAEDASRMANFLATKERVERHNAKSGNSYLKGLNHMADWTNEERARLNGFKPSQSGLHRSEAALAESEAYLDKLISGSKAPIPDELDLRQVPGIVGPVGDQGHCGSCWAFATVGALEGQQVYLNITKSKVIPLSVQELVDCSSDEDCGCSGGNMGQAMADIATLGGIGSDQDYPYKAVEGKCNFDKKKAVMSDIGSYGVYEDEEKLRHFIALYGPVAVGVYASDNFFEYHSGVFVDELCSNENFFTILNHAMLVVGYGTDPKDGDYWIVKNSWGESWGEKGFIRMKRGVNICAITKYGAIPKFP